MVFRRSKAKTAPVAKKTPDPRAELVSALAESGEVVASACGVCGATVAADDQDAVQTYAAIGKWPHSRKVRSWRYHGVCHRAAREADPGLLALALDPDARPIRITQAIADVAWKLGGPLRYEERKGSKHTDRGRQRWIHAGRPDLAELRDAVARRERELTVPVCHSSGLPCQVCGRSHELLDRWSADQGRPACGTCSAMIARARTPGNRRLEDYAADAGRHMLPPRGVARFLLARDLPSYSRPPHSHDCNVPTPPWSYVAEIPEIPLTPEEQLAERLAEVEAKLAGAAG